MNETLELCACVLTLAYLNALLPNAIFSAFVAFSLSLAYFLVPYDGDMFDLADSSEALSWAESWVRYYIAYLFVDLCHELSQKNLIIVIHHVIALVGFCANAESLWGTVTLFSVFLLEPSGMLANIRQILRSDGGANIYKGGSAAFDASFATIYIATRCFVFPYRMYRCFTELRQTLPESDLGSQSEVILGYLTLSASIALNLYWSCIIIKKVADKLLFAKKIK